MCAQGVPVPIPSRPVGKPTLCTPEIIAAVEHHISVGGYPTTALESLDISGECHAHWCKRAEQDYAAGDTVYSHSVYCRYVEAVKRAKAAWIDRKLRQAESVHLRAATDRPELWPSIYTGLERSANELFGRRQDYAPSGAPVQIVISYEQPRQVSPGLASTPEQISVPADAHVIEVSAVPVLPAAEQYRPPEPTSDISSDISSETP